MNLIADEIVQTNESQVHEKASFVLKLIDVAVEVGAIEADEAADMRRRIQSIQENYITYQ